jgi:DNA mismatch repair ATPase MutS
MNAITSHTLKTNSYSAESDKTRTESDQVIGFLRQLAQSERNRNNYNLLKHSERQLLGYLDLKEEEKAEGIAPPRLRWINNQIEMQKEIVMEHKDSIRERHHEEVIEGGSE